MKRTLIPALGLLLFASCTKSDDDNNGTTNPPPGTTSKIFFDGYDDNVSSLEKWNEIYAVNTDGTGQQQLTNFSNNGTIGAYSEEPAVNTDGTKVYFISDKDLNNNAIYSMNTDGSGVVKAVNNTGADYFYKPFVFQTGIKIIYYKEINLSKVGEIYSANIDGSNETKLTTYAIDGNCQEGTVNPANTTIAYACKKNGVDYQIYTMTVAGASKTLLTTNNTLWKSNPKYSPDGSKIIFEGAAVSATNKHSEVFIMNANGTGITQLTNYSSNGTNGTQTLGASFSKDGTTIYYVSDESGLSQIYKMNVDGSGKTKLTSSSIDKYNPVAN